MPNRNVADATLKAPFPYFGGKKRAASLVWDRFGNVPNYVEPFCGSCAMLLSRPTEAKTETINDASGFIANFWRALQRDPDGVAGWADYPVSELDLIARNRWLQAQGEFLQRMKTDPDYFDAKIAGWWVWGKCAWIAEGWCREDAEQLPHLGNPGMGINRRLPHLGDPSRGEYIRDYFEALAARLRDVRIACGDWQRVTGPTITWRFGVTGVFLDPPYYTDNSDPYCQKCDPADVAAWCIESGDNPLMRIALCGYEGGYEMPADWECVPWKTAGGYGSQGNGRGKANAHRERIWFSPHCQQTELF